MYMCSYGCIKIQTTVNILSLNVNDYASSVVLDY